MLLRDSMIDEDVRRCGPKEAKGSKADMARLRYLFL
jgi:hypothetical protein